MFLNLDITTVPSPYRFPGIYPIGCIFFILNIVLFLFNVSMMSLRFYYYPFTFRASLTHPSESLFVPALVISFGTILLNISQYGVGKAGTWLEDVMIVLFWIDCALAVLFSWGIFLMMYHTPLKLHIHLQLLICHSWSTTTFTIAQMTPVWIFPAYPLLIIGPHAANLAAKVSPASGLDIIVGGFIIQGIGFLVSLMVYSAFIYRLMTQKLPMESARPAMFISVGPSGFTISGIVGMGNEIVRCASSSPNFMGTEDGEFAAKVTQVAANWVGLWLWGLALWFFLVAVGAHFSPATQGKLHFGMTWWSLIFPNTALTTATFAVARALDHNRPIQILGLVMTVGLVIMWFFVFVMMIRSVYLKQILWPQKQEDRDEGGWNGLQRQKTWEDNKGTSKRFSIAEAYNRRRRDDEELGPHDK